MKTELYETIQQDGVSNSRISAYLGLVRKIAIYLRPRIPSYVETDDMIQLGTLGLIEAEKKFDANQELVSKISQKAGSRAQYSTRCAD